MDNLRTMHAAPTAAPIGPEPPQHPYARRFLLLIIAISLFNYIDRQILSACLPFIKTEPSFGFIGNSNEKFWLNLLGTAFLVTYTIIAPLFGWLGDRMGKRWPLVGLAIIAWSLASGGSGLATMYNVLLVTRCLIGVGEGAYGPVGMALITDSYPPSKRGFVIALISASIPVGSALGYAFGTVIGSAMGWRWAFYAVVPPGIILGLICFFMKEPNRGAVEAQPTVSRKVGAFEAIKLCLKVPSYFLAVAGYTAITFVTGGIAVVVVDYVQERRDNYEVTAESLAEVPLAAESKAALISKLGGKRFEGADDLKSAVRDVLPASEVRPAWGQIRQASRTKDSPDLASVGIIFGGITVVAGLTATLAGAYIVSRLKARMPSAEFVVSAAGAFLGGPLLIAFEFAPFPLAWVLLFLAIFCLFLNTGPVNTIPANVIPPAIRSTAFALLIFSIHAFGDVISPPIIGVITDWFDWRSALIATSLMSFVAGFIWLLGCKYLQRDEQRIGSLLAK